MFGFISIIRPGTLFEITYFSLFWINTVINAYFRKIFTDEMLNMSILAIKRFKTASQARRNFRNSIEISRFAFIT